MKKQKLSDDDRITDEFLITRQFRTADAFSLFIETSAVKGRLTCLERLVEYCEAEDIDIEASAILINTSLKDKIQAEAEGLNLIHKSSGRLPI